ncbi:hypothetical protein [Flavobacterium sp.]|uniref:hypothetical protein n=1 Tax=Flavobacterium sp. TaxID=239 RepID=UPI002626E415|nr:hypothetical protein [Flavobacterium sp.]
MKKLIVFILLLVNSLSFACGFYPYGEDIRMRFLDSNHFNCQSFDGFHYSSNYYYDASSLNEEKAIQPNDKLWFEYCKGKVSLDAIIEAVYKIESQKFSKNNANKLIQFLYQQNDFEAINYLKFAKSCEVANMFYSDPWERAETIEIKIVRNKVSEALKLAEKTKNGELKLRYKFLAIRLAFYGGLKQDVIAIYNTISNKNPNSINYWCMHFRAMVEQDKSLQNFYTAQVFANASDKRFPIYSYYDREIPLNDVLKYAKTNSEKANIYAFAATKKYDKALNYLKKAFELNPKSDFNIFILLREINKIEDWVFTPYYTNFNPSISEEDYWNNDNVFSYKALEKRINSDRKYADELLNFLNSISLKNDKIEVCKAQLSFIAQKYESSLIIINNLEKKLSEKDSLLHDVQIIKALNLTARQAKNKAVITNEVKSILLKNKNHNRFLFAIARELEYLGNTTDAAFLFSKVNDVDKNGYYDDYGPNISWKSRKHKRGSYRDYFYDYFGYVDVLYTPKQLESIINKSKVEKDDSEFDKWLKARMIREKSSLYDLLGTKYIRRNKLYKALESFKKVDEKYWNDYYSNWNINSSGSNSFDKNPFFAFNYTPDFIKNKETFYVTKVSYTQKLIEYLNKAKNPKEKNRDYYYFIIANGYKNMTINGNSWMMRRYSVSSYDVEPFPEDEAEFQNGYLSKKFYRLAYKYSKTKKFKALCLWLAEDYKKLKRLQESEYYDLSNKNCNAFEEYFNARR